MHYYSLISNVLENAKKSGFQKLDDGTLLLCSLPQLAEEAWLHQIFKGLSVKQIVQLEDQLSKKIPQPYRNFLEEMNGAIFYSGSLALDGFRENYSRDKNIWQPFDLLTPNVYERLADAKNSYFFIGSYNCDGSLLYIDTDNNSVFRCSRDTSKPLNRWNDFEEMMKFEVNRLSSFFDEKGNELDTSNITTP